MTTDKAVSRQSQARPFNPYLVLLVAILLPGFGHVLNGQTKRGLTMQLFMIALAFVTWQLAPASATFIGKLSGGLFVYALSIPEAYRVARLRWETSQKTEIAHGQDHYGAGGSLSQRLCGERDTSTRRSQFISRIP
jgi:hypothetical protein